MSHNATGSGWDVYLDTIREHAHQLLAWGYADARSRFHADTIEPEITGLIGEAMQRRIYDPSTTDAYLHYAIGDQAPISPNDERGNNRLRLDLCVRQTGIRCEIVYIFEAKRLRTGGFPIGKYIGNGGMGDFIECRYAIGYPEAAMVGLWQDKDHSYWIQELKNALAKDRASDSPVLNQVTEVAQIKVIAEVPHEFRSSHRRKDGSAIALCHIFLDCS